MSITGPNILTIAEVLADMASVSTVDYVIPSPFRFTGKANFWSSIDAIKDTKPEIETALIRAIWIRYLRFEDVAGENENAQEVEGPVKQLIYELTVFAESSFERLDETVPLDSFDKLVSKTNHEHVTAIMELCGVFQGANPISGLSEFAVAETVALTQTENTQYEVACDFVPDATGDQTKLEARVNIQLPC